MHSLFLATVLMTSMPRHKPTSVTISAANSVSPTIYRFTYDMFTSIRRYADSKYVSGALQACLLQRCHRIYHCDVQACLVSLSESQLMAVESGSCSQWGLLGSHHRDLSQIMEPHNKKAKTPPAGGGGHFWCSLHNPEPKQKCRFFPAPRTWFSLARASAYRPKEGPNQLRKLPAAPS